MSITDFTKSIVDYGNFDISQIGSALLYGISVLLIGMITIFAVLCILWLFLIGFKLLFHDLPKKKSAKKKATPVVNLVERKTESSESLDGELIAVITAAVAMAEKDHTGMKFKVVSFRRV